MEIVSRAAWGARPPRSVEWASWAKRDAFVVHYGGTGTRGQTPRVIQDYHMDHNGWSDVGYNFLVKNGVIYEGRGWDRVSAAIANHNSHTISAVVIGGDGDANDADRAALVWLYAEACRRAGKTLLKRGHRDYNQTACPGGQLYAWVRAGMDGATPAPPAGGSWWAEVMSKMLTVQRGTKGGAVRKCQAWLNVFGYGLAEDGDCGPKTDAAIRAFQAAHGLDVDGECGPKTWTALALR